MLRKDYIIRLTEEFGKFIGTVFSLKKDNKFVELEELISTSSQKYTNIEIEIAENLSNENFIEILLKSYNLSTENIKMLGDLLYEKGLLYAEQIKKKESQNAFHKAFILFRYKNTNALESDFSLDMHYKMKRLEQLLGLKDE